MDDEFDPEKLGIDPPKPAKSGNGEYARGYLLVPAQIVARDELNPVSSNAWRVLCRLLRKRHNRTNSDGTISLTNHDMAKCKVFCRQKRRVLDELAAHGFLTHICSDHANPQVTLNRHLLK
jgi:hypothetical protein